MRLRGAAQNEANALETQISPDPEHLRTTLDALEEELERARMRLQEGQAEIVDLERRKAEAAGSVVVAERAIKELEERLAEEREALARVERLAEAEREVSARVGERDAVARDLGQAVTALLTQLDELDAARQRVAMAHHAVRALEGRGAVRAAPPEPDEFVQSWERLVERLREDLGAKLDRDLIEAAARSPFGNAINDLPIHLRTLAAERRRALVQESRSQSDDDTPTIPGRPAA